MADRNVERPHTFHGKSPSELLLEGSQGLFRKEGCLVSDVRRVIETEIMMSLPPKA